MKPALVTIVLCLLGRIYGAEADDLFRNIIQPVLKRDCEGCHGKVQAMARLDLSGRAAALRGGQRGSALTPGQAEASLLFRAIEAKGDLKMPPGDASKRLPGETVAAFRRWIDGGAPWADSVESGDWGAFKEADLWAFRPLRQNLAHSTVDGFIGAKLAEKRIPAARRADARILIRRATIDLTGLPPSPAEVDAFAQDPSPAAYAKLIDRLLASKRYGERWGRHWLDVVRYADTGGYSNDFERPNAWRYRDYVIRAFNADKPYDQFIREQIAGDELYPGDPEALIATGFLRAGPWEHTAMSVEAVTRQMFLDDVTHAVNTTFLGLTAGCARCHDHKFDPIPTKDYYRMQAIFASTEFARPAAAFLPEENTKNFAAGREYMARIVENTRAHMKVYDDLILERTMKQFGASRAEDLPAGAADKAKRSREALSASEMEESNLYRKHLQLYRESLDRFEPKAFAVSSGPLDGATDGGANLKYPARAKYRPPDVAILPGGNVESPGEKVTPGLLSLVARYSDYAEPAVPSTIEGRRSVLAKWIATAGNPLTARVMANRVWQYHFGRGIAADSNNFGKMGRKPTHPELLDWLAARFIQQGWSVKALHREIMLSAAYQRSSSAARPDLVDRHDAGNELLSYFPPRRVEAEVIRDAILLVAGELSSDAGGPGTFPQINEDVARQPQHRMGSLAPVYRPSALKRDRNRRSVYSFQQRSLVDPMIDVFNGASMDFSCERRETSVVPTQAFTLFNSQFVQDMALAGAARIAREAATPAGRIDRAFQLAFGRVPTDQERRISLARYEQARTQYSAHPAPPRAQKEPVVHMITSELTGEQHRFVQQEDPAEYEENFHPSQASPETRALAHIMLALFNSNEFAYVD
jgi:hypothetical protein